MSAGWPKARLDDVLSARNGSETVDASASYPNVGIFSFGRGLFEKPPINGNSSSATTLYRIESGQFIYSRLFAFEGAYGIVPPEFDGYFVSNEFPTFDCKSGAVCPEFLGWLFRRPHVWADIAARAKGVGDRRRRIHPDALLGYEIWLPPIEEQRRIVARIEALAAEIDHARTLRQQAAEEAEAFVTSLHAQLSGSRTRKLGDIIELNEITTAVRLDHKYPQVGVRSFGKGLFSKSAVLGNETTYKSFNTLYDGCLVLSQVKGWEGAVAVCPTGLAGWYASPEYRTFRCVPSEVRSKYLAEIVPTKWFWSRLQSATRGVGARRERTRPEQFLGIELPWPDVDDQKYAESILAEVKRVKALQAEIVAEIDALLPAILDRAFRGDLLSCS